MDMKKFAKVAVKMTNNEFRQFFDALRDAVKKDMDVELAYIVARNARDLADEYGALMAALYDPSRDPEYAKYAEGGVALAHQYADRNPETGEPVLTKEGMPVIKDQLVEFQEAAKKYQADNARIIQKAADESKKSEELLRTTRSVTMTTWADPAYMPEGLQISPVLLAFLMDGLFQ